MGRPMLPAVLEQIPQRRAGTLAAPHVRHAEQRPLRVALAEDDDAQRAALEEALQIEGFDVVVLEDGFELLDFFSMSLSTRADAIVSDLMMPGCSGLDGLELARRRGLEVPIFVVSGEENADSRTRVARLGNALFLRKPVNPAHLARAIHELSGVHEMER
jgi:DNA-binding response OmpR family regulator